MHADRVRAGLRLRAAALTLFERGNIPEWAHHEMLESSAETWALFLKAESCALPLARTLKDRAVLDALRDDVRNAIQAARLEETQRTMLAAHVLREVDTLALELGITAAVLKGGVLVADPSATPLDLGDVDLLVSPGAGIALWNALRARGWVADEVGMPADSGEALKANHYAPLVSERHGFKIELHEGLRYGDGPDVARIAEQLPLLEFRALTRLVGPAYVGALLRHSVVLHPFRRGHVRDLVLIAQELEECSESDVRAVRDDIRGDRWWPELSAMLEQSLAMRDGTSLADPPANLPHVALKYLEALGYGGDASRIWGSILVLHVPLERAPIRRAFYTREIKHVFAAPGANFSRLQRWVRIPVLGAAMSWVVRAGYRVALLASVEVLGAKLRRDVRRALP